MVALKKGDLTAEEAMEIKRQIKEASKSNESGEFRAARSQLGTAEEGEPVRGSLVLAQLCAG